MFFGVVNVGWEGFCVKVKDEFVKFGVEVG